MRKEYKDLLKKLEEHLIKAEAFSKKVPLYAEKIIKEQITGEEDWIRVSDRYKDISLEWGISRGFYRSGSRRTMTNKSESYSGYFWSIYVNTLTLYNSYEKYNLGSLKDKVFYYDIINSTFYCTDEQIEHFLESLNNWYLKALESYKKDSKQSRIDKMKKEIEKKQKDLDRLAKDV